EKDGEAAPFPALGSPDSVEVVPNQNGEFRIRNLEYGSYRIEVLMPEIWYLREIILIKVETKPPSTLAAALSRLSDSPPVIRLGQGPQADFVKIDIAAGAAALSGRVGTASKMPDQRRAALLVPDLVADRDNPFRFASASIDSDGRFSISNVAPGKYHLL